MTKQELQVMIDEMVEEAILNEGIFSNIKAISQFDKLYKKAMSSKKYEDVIEALNYYKKNIKLIYKKEIPDNIKTQVHNLNKLKEEVTLKKKMNEKELNKILNEMIKYLKSYYNKIKNTKEFKDKIKKSIEKYNKDGWGDTLKPNFMPNVTIKIYDEFSYNIRGTSVEASIEILDEDQDIVIEFNWIVVDLLKVVRNEFPKFIYRLGDGDEGLIYINH